MSAPRATACIISPALTRSRLVISRTAAFMVWDMFVPVSPSGTGKTLSWSTACRFFSSSAAPADIISFSRIPSIVLSANNTTPYA